MAGSKANPELVSGATGSSGAEETSPDLLKNTPSNIARLEDAIEQCKGRQKYLAQTRSPSDGGDVRWYFCEVPLAENGEFSFPFNKFGSHLKKKKKKLACLIPKCLVWSLRGGKVRNLKVKILLCSSLPFSVMLDAFICVSSFIMYYSFLVTFSKLPNFDIVFTYSVCSMTKWKEIVGFFPSLLT